MADAPWRIDAEGVTVAVRLTPGAPHGRIGGTEILADGRTVVNARVRAAPEKRRANEALEAPVAKALGIPLCAVTVVGGRAGRLNGVTVAGGASG